jgi:histidinol-phosphatase
MRGNWRVSIRSSGFANWREATSTKPALGRFRALLDYPQSVALTFSPADDLALALAVAEEADRISMDRFRAQDLRISTKPDRTPVTDADRAVEDHIRDALRDARPRDQILGEERGHSSGTESSREWVIDPIDGTSNFLRGMPVWATLIALTINGVPQVGVVTAPALGRRWWAATGHGAQMSEYGEHRSLHVSKVASLSDAAITYNSLPGWIGAGRGEQAVALASAAWRARAIGDFWGFMMVAEGAMDVCGEFDLQPYDIAALWPIVTEAGGRFSSVDGDESLAAGSALATNGLLHDEVLELVRA